MVAEGSEGSESDGNGHYEHAPLIVRRHGTEAERASSPTRRPAPPHKRPPPPPVLVLEYSFIKLGELAARTSSLANLMPATERRRRRRRRGPYITLIGRTRRDEPRPLNRDRLAEAACEIQTGARGGTELWRSVALGGFSAGDCAGVLEETGCKRWW